MTSRVEVLRLPARVLELPFGKDVLMTAVARVVVLAAGILTGVVTARLLEPAGRGEYFVVVTFAQLVVQFTNLGLQSSNTYLVARDRSLLGPLLANSVWISVLVGAGVAALLVVPIQHGWIRGIEPVSSLWCAVPLVPASLFYMLGGNLLVGLREMGRFNGFQVASAVVLLLLLTAAGLTGAGPTGFLIACSLGWTGIGVAMLRSLRRMSNTGLAFHTPVFKTGFSYAQRAYLATFMGFLVLRSNVFVLNALRGPVEVGYYSIATQFADVLAIVPQSAALVLFPVLVQEQSASFDRTLKQIALMAPLLAAACLIVGIAARPIIALAFGASFLPAVPVLRWMLPSAFFLGLTSIASQHLAAAGFPRRLVAVWAVGLVSAIAMSYVLIRSFPTVGASAALSAAHALVFVLVFALSWMTHLQMPRAVIRTERGER